MCEFYARGKTYDELHEQVRRDQWKWGKYVQDTPWKFFISAYNHTIPQRRQKDVVEDFNYMDFQGRIDMNSPEVTLACFEECEP